MSELIEVSIIMPTYNKSSYLDLTLAAYTKQDYKNFEIVIIDDGSTDATSQVIKKYCEVLNINYIRFDSHTNASIARNYGLKSAKGTIIINVDDDRIPVIAFISEHVRFLRNNSDTVSIGCKYSMLSIYNEELRINQAKLLDLIKRYPEIINKLKKKKQILIPDDIILDCDNQLSKYYLYEPPDNFSFIREVFGDNLDGFYFGWIMATGGNMAFNRSNAENIWFDESYEGWGCEDCDFAYQLYLKGYRFHFQKDAINYHQEHPRKPGEWDSLKKTLKHFCQKFDSIETYLWARTFKYEANYTHLDANEIFKSIQNSSVKKQTIFLNKYRFLCKEDLRQWWGDF